MKKVVVIIVVLVCVLFFVLVIFFPKEKGFKSAEVCFGENHAMSGTKACFLVEVATTAWQHQKGLMFREYLEKNRGMLFIFEKEGDYPFWMKNTLIPLDIIWINENREVVFIAENVQPCGKTCHSIYPGKNTQYVLEVNGGMAAKAGISIGDTAWFQ